MTAVKSHLATSIGRKAFETLIPPRLATVAGVTSRGIFLQLSSQNIIFLSGEPYRGPLTVNVAATPAWLLGLPLGATGNVHSGRIFFPSEGFEVKAERTMIWHSPAPARPSSSNLGSRDRLRCLAGKIVEHKAGQGFNSWLAQILDLPRPVIGSRGPKSILTNLLGLQQALSEHNAEKAYLHACRLLGKGEGLTPSGDDVVLGLLLFLNRWQATAWSNDNLRTFNQKIVQAAYRQTTALSANLIECAVHGEADERLISAVDGIVCGAPPEPQILTGLIGWGHTSGADALLGIALLLTSGPQAI